MFSTELYLSCSLYNLCHVPSCHEGAPSSSGYYYGHPQKETLISTFLFHCDFRFYFFGFSGAEVGGRKRIRSSNHVLSFIAFIGSSNRSSGQPSSTTDHRWSRHQHHLARHWPSIVGVCKKWQQIKESFSSSAFVLWSGWPQVQWNYSFTFASFGVRAAVPIVALYVAFIPSRPGRHPGFGQV